jgi:hypothetical protein
MVETSEVKQVSRAASSVLFPEPDFGVADNGTYPSEDFQRVLAQIDFDNEFANAGAKTYELVFVEEPPDNELTFHVQRAWSRAT